MSTLKLAWLAWFYSIALVLFLSLAGCKGGGYVPVQPSPEPEPVPVDPAPTPEPGPQPDPGPIPEPCEIDTKDFGCVSMTRYDDEKNALVTAWEQDIAYKNNDDLIKGNVSDAWAHIQLQHGSDITPGNGVKVGLIDDGVYADHFLFQGASISETFMHEEAKQGSLSFTPGTRDTNSHGTSVASHIIAQGTSDDPERFYGVAPGVDLHMYTVHKTDKGTVWHLYATQEILPLARNRGIDILNISLGGGGGIENYDTKEDYLYEYAQGYFDALIQADYQDKILIVRAAGNDGSSSVSEQPGMPVFIEEVRSHYVSVVGTGQDGLIADMSNRCGIAADWCITSPGGHFGHAFYGLDLNGTLIETVGISGGTSLNAGYVTGSLALIKHMFRDQLSNVEVLQRLYATANKTGPYADRSIYGQGLVDVGAATSPVGILTIGDDDQANTQPAAQTGIQLGAAFGDGLVQGLVGLEVAAFDTLNAPFFLPADNLVSVRERYTPARVWRPGFMETETGNDWSLGFFDRDPGGDSGHVSLADRVAQLHNPFAGMNISINTFASLSSGNQPSLVGGDIRWHGFDNALQLKAGLLIEQNSLLGAQSRYYLDNMGSRIAFTGLQFKKDWLNWAWSLEGELGRVTPNMEFGLIDGMSHLLTSTFNLQATRALNNNHQLRLAIAQPLRVESGKVDLVLPSGRQKDGSRMFLSLSRGLAPTGRQIDATARLRGSNRLFGGHVESFYDLAATYSRQPYHRKSGTDVCRCNSV